MSEWQKFQLQNIAIINPKERLAKRTIAKKIAMENLQPFQKKIQAYSYDEYKGGAKFKNGDTLIARITPSLENGKTSFVDILEENEIGFGSTEFIVLREIEGVSNKNFLFYLACSPEFRDVAISSMTGSSGRQRVQPDVVILYEFYLPSLPEQEAIAEVLSSLDDKIDLLHRQNQTLEALAETLFRQWFVEEAQDDWEEKPLDEIADYLNGLACQKYPPQNDAKKLPVLKIKDLRNGISENSDFATSEVAEEYIINNGDVIFSWSGSLLVKIWGGGKCVLNQHLFKVTSENYPKWFFYLWTKHHLRKFITIASSKATTMGHIKRKDLSDSKVLVPPDDVINNMNLILIPILEKVELNNRQKLGLKNMRDTLLPNLLSGEIRVKF